MDDESNPQPASEFAAGAPPNRDRRPGTVVIEGEISPHPDPATPADVAAKSAPVGEPPSHPAPRPNLLAGALGGLIGGLVGALLMIVALWSFDPRADGLKTAADRLAALDQAAKAEATAVAGLSTRIQALEAAAPALDKRLTAIEGGLAVSAPKVAAAGDAAGRLGAEVATLRADVDAARGEIPALGARVGKLESAPAGAPQADLSGVETRLKSLEAALAAPKTEARAPAESAGPNGDAASVALVAEALGEKLTSGAPYGAEYSALERLKAEPAALAMLKPLAETGAPTAAALAAEFDRLTPAVLAAAAPEPDGVWDKLTAHARKLVRVRAVGEAAGDDPEALASQIAAATRRGEFAKAAATVKRLPETARTVAADWAGRVERRAAADAALARLRAAALARMSGTSE